MSLYQKSLAWSALALCLSGCGGSETWIEGEYEPLGRAEQDLFGETEPETLLQLVAKDSTVPIRNLSHGRCSGTLVRRNTVLTARHCITTDGTPKGPLAPAGNILVGDPSVLRTTDLPSTSQACKTSSTCRVVFGRMSLRSDDIAMLRLSPLEATSIPDDTYVPIHSGAGRVGEIAEVAGYGLYNPNQSDPEDSKKHYGELEVTSVTATSTVRGASGTVVKAKGVNNTLVQGGDSGMGIWTSESKPWGIFGVLSGSPSCSIDDFCDTAQAPHASVMKNNVLTEDDSYSKDWEFSRSAEENDFTEELLGNSDDSNWHIGSGQYAQWKNRGKNMVIGDTVVERSCVRTKVRTTDNDVSGIVFRYIDSNNYYLYSLSDQDNYARLTKVVAGRSTRLANSTWRGSWSCYRSGRSASIQRTFRSRKSARIQRIAITSQPGDFCA